METNWNQLIERYLNGELSAEGKAAFEQQLKESTELQKELELHQLTQNLIKRATIRNMVQQSGKRFQLRKKIVNASIVVIIATALATAVYFIAVNSSNPETEPQVETVDPTLLEEMSKELAFENVDPQYFKFTGNNDVFLSESGVLLSITENSFLLDGKSYQGEAVVQWQEAQTAADIVKAGLSTTSGDKLLETQGMFSLNAFTPDGKKLELSEKGIYVQVPVDELKKDMMLFNGVKGKNGNIDWQSPQELERLPKPKSMKNMDLFPPKYEPKLNELKWFTDKTKRDSLYLSFDEAVGDSTSGAEPNDLFNNVEPEIPFPSSLGKDFPFSSQFSFADSGAKGGPLPVDQVQYTMATSAQRQVEFSQDKVHWDFSFQKTSANEGFVIAKVTILKNWEINAIHLPKGSFGIPTEIQFNPDPGFSLAGNILEPEPILHHDKETEEDQAYHIGTVEFKQKIKIKSPSLSSISIRYTYQTCKIDGYCLPPFSGTALIFIDSQPSPIDSDAGKNHIPPSKVLAIWDKKFDKTNLATQDFEDRMKAIHNTCDERVFDVYANNLNEPLWKLDEKVVKLGYPQFQQFADQHVGALKLNDEHQQNLQAFYEKAIQKLREKGKDAVLTAARKEQEWDEEVKKERGQEVYRKGMRDAANDEEEANYNLKYLSKQLGTTLGFALTSETFPSHYPKYKTRGPVRAEKTASNLPIVVNIDRLTRQLLSSRQSVIVNTMDKSKSAKLVYSPFRLSVDSYQKYDRLYFYLLPNALNSFERLGFINDEISYPLNSAFGYDAVIVGINDEGYFIHEIKNLKPKDNGKIKLKQVSEAEFNRRVNAMNADRNVHRPMEIQTEINWLFKEQANYKVQKQRRENVAFRAIVRPTIYSSIQMEFTDDSAAMKQMEGL